MLTKTKPGAVFDQIEEALWDEFYREQEQDRIHREKATEIENKFPLELSDFNPQDPAYSKHLQSDIAKQLYENLVIGVSEYESRKEN